MTQKMSPNKKRAPLVTRRYMTGMARRGWPLFVLFLIMFLLTYTLWTAITLPNLTEIYTARRLVSNLKAIFPIFSALAAIISGIYFMQFIQSKTSAGFFHSLPERRSGHFISVIFSSFAVYLSAALLSYILSLLLLALSGALYAELLPTILLIPVLGIFYFTVFLSVTVLAGVISGNRVIHAIMTAFLLFAAPVVFITAMLLLRDGVRYLNVSRMLVSLGFLKWLSPVFRLQYVLDGGTELPAWIMILFDAVLASIGFFLAYYAYANRPIERSGNQIVFPVLPEIIKYIIIGPTAVLSSKFFALFEEGWGLFGFFVGLILSFMLCNTVLYRSAKAMFSHIRGMLIYSGAFIVAVLILSFGCFGIFDYTVPVADTISVNFSSSSYGGEGAIISNPDEIAAVRRAVSQMNSQLRNRGAYGEDVVSYSDSAPYEALERVERTESLYINYMTPFGFDLSYSYSDLPYEYIAPLTETILEVNSGNSEYFDYLKNCTRFDLNLEMMLSSSSILDNIGINTEADPDMPVPDDEEKTEEWDRIEDSYAGNIPGDYTTDKYRGALTKAYADGELYCGRGQALENDPLSEIILTRGREYFQHFSMGSFNVRGSQPDETGEVVTYYLDEAELPLFPSSLSKIGDAFDRTFVINKELHCGSIPFYVGDAFDGVFSLSEDEYFDALAETIKEIYVYNKKTGTLTAYEGNDVRRMLPSLAAVRAADISAFTATDGDYNVMVVSKSLGDRYDWGGHYVYYDDSKYTADTDDGEVELNYIYSVTWFLEGQVPAFVK